MGQTPKTVLAENLTRLMAESKNLRTIKQLHAACPTVSTGTIDRVRRATISTSIDTVSDLAAAFGLEAWQLLTPGVKAGEATAPDAGAINAARELLRYAATMQAEHQLPTITPRPQTSARQIDAPGNITHQKRGAK